MQNDVVKELNKKLINALKDTGYNIEERIDGIFILELNILITQEFIDPDPYSCRKCGQDLASCCGCSKEREWQKRNKGEWIVIDDCENFIAKCSKCNKIIDSRCLKPNCSYCGSKMREPGQ